MARPVTTLVVFFLAFNLFAGMLMGTGVASAIGIDANVGGDEVQRVADEDVETGSATGSTLFGMYNVLTERLSSVFTTISPGLNMMQRAGVPDYIIGGFLGPIFSLLILIDIVSFMRGWGL